MIYLRIFFLTFLFSCLFASCSTVTEQPSPSPSPSPSASFPPASVVDGKRFESQEGNFSIDISQPPSQTLNLEPETAGGKAGKHFIWKLERTGYTLMYDFFDLEKGTPSEKMAQMNSGFRKGTSGKGLKLIYEKEISFGKYTGTEFRIVAPNGATQVARNYLVNNMGYLLTAAFYGEKDEKEALKILDSFKLLSEKK
jgi:hypothetical protein